MAINEGRQVSLHEIGIPWFASPWHEGSVASLEEFSPPCYKVASACLTDKELLICLRDSKRPIILSEGMSMHSEIAHAVEILGSGNIVLLHTVSTYPTKHETELNIRMIDTLRGWVPSLPVGYSGHETDILPSNVPASRGAAMIEQHFTLDRNLWGSDQQASITYTEIREIVESVRRIPAILGNREKTISPRELEVQRKLRRKYLY